jgi:hypothetical protein
MRGVLILFTLLGLGLSMVPDMEYHYKYEGRLGMGIPEIRNKFSGTGIKATVTIQVLGRNNAIFKLNDIMIGEFFGDTGIKITNHMPIQFTPMPAEFKILEEPFEVFFNMDKEEVLVVPKSDIEWIVNIRKSIAQLFLIEPIRSNFGLSKVFNSNQATLDAFTLYEPTLFGTCSVDYAFLPIGFTTMDKNKNIEVINNVDEDYYLLTRSINFDKCKEYVYVEGYNTDSNVDYRRSLTGDVSSRSSVMNVKLVGKPGKFVLQEGNVNGYFAFSPFAVTKEKMMSMTNQTIVLKSKNKITNKMVVPTPNRIIKTLYTAFSSPFAAPTHPSKYFNYYNEVNAYSPKASQFRVLTGIPFNPDYSKKYMRMLDEILMEATKLTTVVESVMTIKKTIPVATNEVKINNLLQKAMWMAYYVDVKDLEELFNTYYNDKSELGQMKMTFLVDVSAAGGYFPLKFVINEMKKGRITPERITTIFSTIPNSYTGGPILKDIMTFVKTIDYNTHPVMMTNVLVNFATMLKTSCVTPYKMHFHKIWYGMEACDMNIITEEFIPFLKQKFETSTEIYQRRSIVRAMSNLGTPEAIKFIAHIATGKYDVNVRAVAILGLTHRHVNKTVTKDEIFDLLMPIVHNIREDAYLRQMAIKVLVTYKPTASWWQRLATSTWREPSKSVGSFIYYLIKNNYYNTDLEYSQDARIAHFLLPMTKPYPPTSTYSYKYAKFIPEMFSNIMFKSAVYKDDETMHPRNIYSKLVGDFGGDKMTLFETMFSTNVKSGVPSNILQQISKMIPDELKKIMNMAPNRDAEDVLMELKKYLNPSMFMNDKSYEYNMYLRFFDNLQYVLPINHKTLPLNIESFDFLKTLMSGKKLHFTKFFDSLAYKSVIPTEIGLSTFMFFESPTFFSAETDVKLMTGENEANMWHLMNLNSLGVDMNTNMKFVTKYQAEIKAFLPWNKKSIKTGVSNVKSFNLPLKVRTTFENQGTVKNISMEIVPTCTKCVFAHVHNIPYIAIDKVFPESMTNYHNKYEVLTVNGEGTGMYKNKHLLNKEVTGLDAGLVYEGDIHYPFTYANFYDIMHKPYKMLNKIMSPTCKLFTSSFVVDFDTSETKTFKPSISFTMPKTMMEKNMISKKKTTGDHSLFTMKLFLTGTETRFFESSFEKKVLSKDATVKRTDYLYKYVQHYPNVKPQAFCVQVEARTPIYNDFKTLLTLLTSNNMKSMLVGKVMGGTTCKDTQFTTVKGAFKISDKMTKVMVDKITKELNINKYSKIDRTEKPFFDQTTLLLEFKEPLPTFFTNMTYHMYDVLRGAQFPYLHNNYYNVKNQKGRIFIEGERHLDGTYSLRTELPTENMIFESFNLPFMYKLKLYLFGYDVINDFPILGVLNNIFF